MSVGYAFLVKRLNLSAFPPKRQADVSPAVAQRIDLPDRILIPPRMAPESDSLVDQVLFALKHEDVNLQILSEALPVLSAQEVRQKIIEKPSSMAVRKLGFLWEAFSSQQIEDISIAGKYVDLFNPAKYFTGEPRRIQKWRVNFNGIGNLKFCPWVERTEKLSEDRIVSVFEKARETFDKIPPALVSRAVSWAYLSETRSSFEIEQELPSGSKAERFIKLLKSANILRQIDEDYLCDIQNQVVRSPFDHAYSFRTTQNWLSNSSLDQALGVAYIPPPPDVIDDLMAGFLQAINTMPHSVNPVAAAAIASFGFVYFHPFLDGNGRISRFLIHQQLAQAGALPKEAILPVSAAMLKHEGEYLRALESFSKPCRERWTVMFGNKPEMTFNGKASLYRFWDATPQTEFLLDMIETALDEHLVEEIQFLKQYDRLDKVVNEAFDIRQNYRDALVAAAVRRGRLSKNIRKRFADKVDPEAFDFIDHAAAVILNGDQDEAEFSA